MLINAQLRIEQIFQKFHELRAAEIHNGVSASFTKQWEEIEANLFAW